MKQYRFYTFFIIVAVVILGIAAFMQSDVRDKRSATHVVEAFGTQLQKVPLSGTADIARTAMQENYAPFVTDQLLKTWSDNPDSAPGRLTSSPWPDHVEITSVTKQGEGYVITGTIISKTSVEQTQGGAAGIEPFVAQVIRENDQWQIAAFQIQQSE